MSSDARAIGAEQRTAAFATLGCKLNQFETDSIATQLSAGGYDVVGFDEPADVYVINSCTVTNRADRKSRNLWNRANRKGAITVLTGCFVDSHRDELESDGQTYIVPNEEKQSIPALVDAHFRGEIIHPQGSVFDFPVPDRRFHTRTTLKVQDGCDNHCTFCIIPQVRGRAQSRPAQQIIESAQEAIAGGARELVLTGVNMSRYRDGDTDFTDLVAGILDASEESFRVRISSLEPERLGDRFVELFRHPRMAPHLHLCLQSGSARTLLAMRRQYTIEEYRALAAELRSVDPLFNLTTDIIVGFPGETDEQFADSVSSVAEYGFGHVHTFPYSVREGTRAQRMPGHLPARIKTERARAIREASEASKRAYRAQHIGREARVLIERVDEGESNPVARGLSEHYVPVQFEIDSANTFANRIQNRFARILINGIQEGDDPSLVGRLLSLE